MNMINTISGIKIEKFSTNLGAIITDVDLSKGVNDDQFKDIETMEIMNDDLDEYSDVIRKLSLEFNTKLLDLRKIFMQYISENNPGNKSKGVLTTDGVHLNNIGSKLIADEMIKFIN